MSEHESTFIAELEEKVATLMEDLDKRYGRMQTFLLTILTVLLSAGLVVGFTHFTRDGGTRETLATVKARQDMVLEQAVSQEAINKIIMSYDNQTKVMEEFLPQDVQGAVREFNKVSNNFRTYIMSFQSGINVRGAVIGGDKADGTGSGGGADK